MEETREDDNVAFSSPLIIDNIALLENGDGTFTYRELLLNLCIKEEKYYGLIPFNNCWPAKLFVQKIFTACNRLELSPITTHTAVTILKRLCVVNSSYVQKQNPEIICFICISLASKIYEKRRRWVKEIYYDTSLVCSKREFTIKEMEVLKMLNYYIDPPVPIQYVNLFLEVYFNKNQKLNKIATDVCHLLYNSPEMLIANHSSLICGIVVLCVSQSILDGGASGIMLSWAKTFVSTLDEICELSNQVLKCIFKGELLSEFEFHP
ncbi:cyclin domain containing protein [Entamoeba histolytica HM-1:IMSS-B]|uniref:Cyclin-like domain-containing protein n=8 Tax=Entamoeba TaxID=5758 RepID=C4LWR1_ENTH1|nr:cyclin, N-terminal domain containing protein [Entamoeba nuttalli P19]XP_655180.2 hypothetical protein EHI_198650 [Entamoeba histolytica HM-1:IMSS]EMD45620.1 cyclin N-terminal domain containing protein [Entamoeba histolytica KU27]EMH72251.1 cyclin domain containing protein [Entamoeba histolytica HM-1:IMSS-B]EMS15925.1 cyclin domain containing protein [Entamoeba histolytica HM-3:IMSS]ENY64435.1 cyclin, N-terminal domain containing protein [Entamoeba histolytica HM-1:IMSS-A]GAT93152.1 cyclin |eukprot:XP_008860151.1 cyclin, N-terminal domain containing protein [Entamoeba nuttalli P19]